MRWIVDACYLVAGVLLAPFALYQALSTGKYRRDWGQRTGRLPELPADRTRVWIHAVSVGETNAVAGLITAWRARCPELEFVISTTTDTGQARAKALFPDLTIVRYPLDISHFVNRAFDRVRPTMIVLVELEVWYQFTTLAARRGIPVAVINGRLSGRSARRFGWVRPVMRRMFESLTWVGAQDEVYADRFRRMGVPAERIAVTGSVKWDSAQVADSIPGADEASRAMGLDRNRPLWVCGSTGPGEEDVILRAWQSVRSRHPGLQLVLVPRKPERFDEVAGLVRRAGFICVRRSESPDGSMREPAANAVALGDTMGELRKFYSLADVVFVGRTLADMGGSDMMEVAALAKPVVVGPHTENFADTVEQLRRAEAIRILSADLTGPRVAEELAETVSGLLDEPDTARRVGQAGREVVQRNRGATQRTLDSLMEILRRAEHRSA